MDIMQLIIDKIEEKKIPVTLQQGMKFKKLQDKIIINNTKFADSLENNNKINKIKKINIENFTGNINDSYINTIKNRSVKSINNNFSNLLSSGTSNQEILSKLSELNILQTQHNSLLQQFQTATNNLSNNTNGYITTTGSNNSYLGKNVCLKSGQCGYVTQGGNFKMYPSNDNNTMYNSTAGKNNCPNNSYQNINGSGDTTLYNSSISSKPPLNVGTPMTSGQSCGNETNNIMVDNDVSSPSSKYIGCYYDESSNPSMTIAASSDPVYTLSTCQQAASDSGSAYFGLQGYDSTTGMSKCYLGNDISTAEQYGIATTNCKADSNGIAYGGNLVNAIYSVPDATYIGSFKDKAARSMTLVNNGSATYTYETCKQAAIENNSIYFGLQNLNNNRQTASCSISNNYNDLSQYGTSNSIVKGKDGKKYGKKWTNSVYQLQDNQSTYIGCYNDNATTPAMTALNNGANNYSFSTCQSDAIDGNYNFFALQGGGDGTSKCFASNSLPQSKQYGVSTPCSKGSDGNIYGEDNVNAIYQMKQIGDPSVVGQIGYINEDGVLSQYQSTMINNNNNYETKTNYSIPSTGTNIINTIQGSNINDCMNQCNTTSNSTGFMFNNTTQTCSIINNSIAQIKSTMFPTLNTDLYIRNSSINNSSTCNKNITNVDSILWKNYVKSNTLMTPTTTCSLKQSNTTPQTNLSNVSVQLNSVTQQIIDILNFLDSLNSDIQKQVGINSDTIKENLAKYNAVNSEINSFATNQQNLNVNNIVNDSDTRVLQENYTYMLWSILAIATVIVTINIMKK